MPTRSLRLPDDLDALLRAAAGLKGLSAQAYIQSAIISHIMKDAQGAKGASLAAMLDKATKKKS